VDEAVGHDAFVKNLLHCSPQADGKITRSKQTYTGKILESDQLKAWDQILCICQPEDPFKARST